MAALEDMTMGVDDLRHVSLTMEALPSGNCMGGISLLTHIS